MFDVSNISNFKDRKSLFPIFYKWVFSSPFIFIVSSFMKIAAIFFGEFNLKAYLKRIDDLFSDKIPMYEK